MIPYDILAKVKTMEAGKDQRMSGILGEQRTDETQEIFRPVKIDICHYTFVHIYSIYMGSGAQTVKNILLQCVGNLD